MKIVIIGTAFPLRGGIAHFNQLLASHLGEKHEVEIITFKRQYPKLFFPGKTQDEPSGEKPNIKITQLVDSINPLNWLKVGKTIRNLKPDLVIFKYWLPFFGPCFGTIAKYAKKNCSTKVLFIPDNVIPHEKHPCDISFTKYAFKYADYFIVQSDSVQKDLLCLFPHAKFRNTPHPVYEIFGKSIEKYDARKQLNVNAEKIILFFGYIRKYKGLHVLLDAMKIISHTETPPTLFVAGEFYDDEPAYKIQIKELNIESFVKIYSEYIPNERVNLFFSAADVVVLPYLSATQSGITQIAYNFDKPVIATNVGGLAEVVLDNKTGYIVEANNPEKLSAAIKKFYSEGLEKPFSDNVKIEKIKYSWDHFIESIEELVSR